MKYLSAEQILFIHARIIDESGGAHGVRDIGLLQSAVSRPQATFGGNELYPDIFSKAAALMESVARNHPFLDGNKRTAISSTGIFLGLNGFRLEASQKELVRFALDIAIGKLSNEESREWLKKHYRSIDFQLDLPNAVSVDASGLRLGKRKGGDKMAKKGGCGCGCVDVSSVKKEKPKPKKEGKK